MAGEANGRRVFAMEISPAYVDVAVERWGVLVLIALQPGTRRFSALRRTIGGVSERMLAQTLQWLEADGMVLRTDHHTVPPHVDYALTPLGREAAEKVRNLADWVETHVPEIVERRSAAR